MGESSLDASHNAYVKALAQHGHVIIGNAVAHLGWPVRVHAVKRSHGDWEIVVEHLGWGTRSSPSVTFSRDEAVALGRLLATAAETIDLVEARIR